MSMHETSTRSRALELLGSGSLEASQVASALGVTPAYISQLLSEEDFAAQVSELRYKNLLKHNERDASLDSLEDKILSKIHETLPFVMRPMELTRMLSVVNAAKRRGQSAPESTLRQQQVVQIVLPSIAVNKFILNAQNQVVQSCGKTLVTMQSGELLAKVKNDETSRPALPAEIARTAKEAA